MNYLSASQAAQRLGLSDRRVRALLKAGRFPGATQIGRAWLIPERAVRAFKPRPAGNPNLVK